MESKEQIYIFSSDPHGTGEPWINKVEKMQKRYPKAITVFGGDYIDGRKFSKETVDYVKLSTEVDPKHKIALMGNHEQLMLDYLDRSEQQGLWFYNGGKSTVKSFCGRGFPKNKTRQAMLSLSKERIDWIRSLPDIYITDNIVFVHAGLDLNKIDPIKETSHYDRIWIREKYFYSIKSNLFFAHNPLDKAIVSGHTPTCLIHGYFENNQPGIKQQASTCRVLTIAYPDEPARYFCDGGCHGHNSNTGNVAVFDYKGNLIDKIE